MDSQKKEILIEKTIRKCANELKNSIKCVHCPVNCEWGTDKSCVDALTEYLKRRIL